MYPPELSPLLAVASLPFQATISDHRDLYLFPLILCLNNIEQSYPYYLVCDMWSWQVIGWHVLLLHQCISLCFNKEYDPFYIVAKHLGCIYMFTVLAFSPIWLHCCRIAKIHLNSNTWQFWFVTSCSTLNAILLSWHQLPGQLAQRYHKCRMTYMQSYQCKALSELWYRSFLQSPIITQHASARSGPED